MKNVTAENEQLRLDRGQELAMFKFKHNEVLRKLRQENAAVMIAKNEKSRRWKHWLVINIPCLMSQ